MESSAKITIFFKRKPSNSLIHYANDDLDCSLLLWGILVRFLYYACPTLPLHLHSLYQWDQDLITKLPNWLVMDCESVIFMVS